ncbi:MAG TPA: carboxypeptidase-like regulatory domain-containing protein [Thermoplasmata archaeon]|nr:carboxypeptidase-like regulatory domain-containing protein [Thermoplasmata archaeon]
MTAPPIPLRCTRCGALGIFPPPPGSGTAWFGCPSCGHPVPVVPWRERAPLFTWEAFPHLYPPASAPRIPSRALTSALLALLLIATAALGGLAASAGYEGAAALGPASFTIAGTVLGAPPTGSSGTATPLAGALVTMHSEGAADRSAVTGPDGTFQFLGVPSGGVIVNASAGGYGAESRSLFVSPVYSTPGTAADPLAVTLPRGNASVNGSVPIALAESPFADLESLVASLWSAAALLAIGTVVAAFGALELARRGRPAFVVAGGAAALTAPLTVFLLGIGTALPWLGAAAAGTAGIGAVVAGTQAIRMASAGRRLEPE